MDLRPHEALLVIVIGSRVRVLSLDPSRHPYGSADVMTGHTGTVRMIMGPLVGYLVRFDAPVDMAGNLVPAFWFRPDEIEPA